jgi:hypothetical protein
MTTGYAINEIGNGGIRVDTVHSTRRAAIVNWLVVSKDMLITNAWSDDMIETAWKSMRGDNDYCIKIEISAVQGADANVTERP